MSAKRGYSQNGKSYYTNVTTPQETFLSFVVNAADTGGLGVTSVKSNGYVESVFMHTSQTPGSVNGVTNPNPASGYAQITFKNNFNYYLCSSACQTPPSTSNSTTATTAGVVYTITALGTASLAQWQAKGFPAGFTPAVGQVFVATASGTIGGSATVGVPGVQTAPLISVVGVPNTMLASSSIAQYAGARLFVQFSSASTSSVLTMNSYTPAGTNSAPALTMNPYTPAGTNDGATPPIFTGTQATLTGSVAAPTFSGTPATLTGTIASTTAVAAAAPTDGTVVTMRFMYDASSVTIDGL